jgi:hypothetical protein
MKMVTSRVLQGTDGYQPENGNLAAGSKSWDIYGYACIILESDLETDEYLSVNNSRSIECKAEKHIKRENVCPHMKQILRGTILRGRLSEIITVDEVMTLLEKVKFLVN